MAQPIAAPTPALFITVSKNSLSNMIYDPYIPDNSLTVYVRSAPVRFSMYRRSSPLLYRLIFPPVPVVPVGTPVAGADRLAALVEHKNAAGTAPLPRACTMKLGVVAV